MTSIKQFRRKMESAKRDIEQSVDERPRQAGQRFTFNAKRQIVENDAVASTDLYRGVGYQSIPNGVTFLSDADHSGYVEHGIGIKGDGRYPDNPDVPVPVIMQWMVQKPSFTLTPTWGLASNIADSISEQGVAPQPFFRQAQTTALQRMYRELRFDLTEALS